MSLNFFEHVLNKIFKEVKTTGVLVCRIHFDLLYSPSLGEILAKLGDSF